MNVGDLSTRIGAAKGDFGFSITKREFDEIVGDHHLDKFTNLFKL